MRRLAFLARGVMRAFLAGVAITPLFLCYQIEQKHPEYLQNPYWIGGAVAGLVFLVFMLRWFGEGRGIARGLVLAVISLGFTNGFAALVYAGIDINRHPDQGIDEDTLFLAIIGAVLVLVCGFILQRMERYRYG